jgi:hypothetical protein
MTGFGVVASYLGQPDAGLATYTDMLNRAEAIVDAIHKPLIATATPAMAAERPASWRKTLTGTVAQLDVRRDTG